MMRAKDILFLIKVTLREWSEDKASRLAAALAYYTSFSLAPMLIVIIAIAGLVGGRDIVYSYVMDQIGNLLGPEGMDFVASMIENSSQPSTGLLAAVLGIVTLLLGSLGIFGELQNALNTIWEVKPKPIKGFGNNVRHFVLKRILSFTMLMVIVFMLLVSLVISAGLSALGEYMGSVLNLPEIILLLINFVISLVLITLLFAIMYKYLPDAIIRWRDVWLGAVVTSLLFTIGKFAIGLYLGKSEISTSFGAAGSLAILLIWIYYSSQILFLGAEFTQVYANHFGAKIQPDQHSTKMLEEERKHQGIAHKDAEPESTPRDQ